MENRVQPVDEPHLDRAMQLALEGAGRVSPNPVVGAVVVRDGEVIGEGWHGEYGGPHAERVAIDDAEARGHDVSGATVYVSLEPCGHHGKQPPCAELLRDKGVAEVVIGCDDTSEKTAGLGPAILGGAGIEVRFAEGEPAERARRLVQDFRKHSATGRPLVTLKMAVSLDGRVAGPEGQPVHLSSPETDRLVHRWRATMDGVAVGAGTMALDNPRLTARHGEDVIQPARVIFGTSGDLTGLIADSALLEDLPEVPVLVVTGVGEERQAAAPLEDLGVELIPVEGPDRSARFAAALDALGERGLRSILLEGGPTLAGAAMDAGCVDRLELFVAPVMLGSGPPMVELGQRRDLPEISVSRSGDDIRISSVLREW